MKDRSISSPSQNSAKINLTNFPAPLLAEYTPITKRPTSGHTSRLNKFKNACLFTFDLLADSIQPRFCALCGSPLPINYYALCTECWPTFAEQQLPRAYCKLCGKTVGLFSLTQGRCFKCQKKRPALTYIARLGTYQGLLRKLLLNFKFKNCEHLDIFFARMLAYVISLNPHLHSVDRFVPIPLHWLRRLERKYNQSELLARAVASELKKTKLKNLKIPVSRDLVRTRYTTPQTLLSPSKRQQNLKNAFAVRPDADFKDKHICLIDDVTTTGTTLQTAARVIKQAGAKKVSAAVLAVTEQQ